MVVVVKSRLAAAVAAGGVLVCSPCRQSPGAQRQLDLQVWNRSLGVQVGFKFKLENGAEKLKEEQAGAESDKYLKPETPSPD